MSNRFSFEYLYGNRTARVLFLGTIIVAFLLINIGIVFHVNRQLRQSVKDDLMFKSRITGEAVAHFFSGKINTILLLDRYKPIRDYLKECKNSKDAAENKNRALIVDMFEAVNGIYVGMEDTPDQGNRTTSLAIAWVAGFAANFCMSSSEIMDEHSKPEPWHTYERDWYPAVKDFDGVAFSDSYIDIEFNVPCISILKKVVETDDRGKRTEYGVVGFDVFLPTVTEIMETASRGSNGVTILVDGNRVVVYHPDHPFVEGKKLTAFGGGYEQLDRLIDRGKQGSDLIEIDGVPTYVGFYRAPIPGTNWFVITMVPKSLAEQTVSTYFYAMFAAGLIDLLLFLLPIGFIILSERRRNVELTRSKDAAIEASRSKSEFLANMSHEIRTPMNGVIGLTDILKNTPPLTPIQNQYVDTIRQSAESLLAIINDILDFSKIEAGRYELEPVDIDLRALIEESCEVIAFRIHEKGVYFGVDIDPDIRGIYRADGSRIRQILLNLLGNAAKFTSEGEILVRVFPISMPDDISGVRFEIIDTGIGIPEEKQAEIFHPFMQADNTMTRRFGGTGLGLAICRHLVTLMGGDIGLQSRVGHGSTFWFTLPIPRLSVPHSSMVEKRYGAGKNILAFEVHAEGVESLLGVLERWGFEATLLQQKDALWEYLDTKKVDLVLFSVDVPGCSLEEFIEHFQRARAQPGKSGIQFILVFSLGDIEAAAIENVPGMVGSISKPIRMNALEQLVRKAIGLKRYVPKTSEHEKTGGKTTLERPLRILLAEDVRVNVMVAVTMLHSMGHEVDVAENGEIALEKLRQNDYDLVLMDCQMPVMDGYQCTETLRRPESGIRNPRIPVIAMTAHAMGGDREKCLAAGMDDYISKPIALQRLGEVIQRWKHESGILSES